MKRRREGNAGVLQKKGMRKKHSVRKKPLISKGRVPAAGHCLSEWGKKEDTLRTSTVILGGSGRCFAGWGGSVKTQGKSIQSSCKSYGKKGRFEGSVTDKVSKGGCPLGGGGEDGIAHTQGDR